MREVALCRSILPLSHTLTLTNTHAPSLSLSRQDAWPVLKGGFTETQLSTLTNLLAAPTYFS